MIRKREFPKKPLDVAKVQFLTYVRLKFGEFTVVDHFDIDVRYHKSSVKKVYFDYSKGEDSDGFYFEVDDLVCLDSISVIEHDPESQTLIIKTHSWYTERSAFKNTVVIHDFPDHLFQMIKPLLVPK